MEELILKRLDLMAVGLLITYMGDEQRKMSKGGG